MRSNYKKNQIIAIRTKLESNYSYYTRSKTASSELGSGLHYPKRCSLRLTS